MATRMATRAAAPVAPGVLRGLATALVAAAAAAMGCSGSSSEAKAAQTVRSWHATLDLLEQAEASGAVPKAFGRQVRQAAEQEQARAREKLQASGKPTR
jgi:hypothetical protein